MSIEAWLADLKVGDKVRRKPNWRNGIWHRGDERVVVADIFDDGTLKIDGCGDVRWQHYKFYPVEDPQ